MIRRAVEKDLPQIVAIYNATIPSRLATADIQPVTVEARKEWFFKHDDERPIWVSVDEATGMIQGWLSFNSFYGRPAYRATVEISVYVADSARRLGIGNLMMDWSFVEARKIGIRTILAFIFSHNGPSISFFERAGFKEWGRFPEIAEMDGKLYGLSIYGLKLE